MEHYLYKRWIIVGVVLVAVVAFVFAAVLISSVEYPEVEPEIWEYKNGNCTIMIEPYNETETELIRYNASGDCIGRHFEVAMKAYKEHIRWNGTG